MSDEESPASPESSAALTPGQTRLSYAGVGCVGAVAGLMGGGMLAVLIAKIVGGVTRCPAAPESGAPCNWTSYWTWGARIGFVLVPLVSIFLLRRGRQRSRNSERG